MRARWPVRNGQQPLRRAFGQRPRSCQLDLLLTGGGDQHRSGPTGTLYPLAVSPSGSATLAQPEAELRTRLGALEVGERLFAE